MEDLEFLLKINLHTTVGSSGLEIIKKGGWINYECVLTN